MCARPSIKDPSQAWLISAEELEGHASASEIAQQLRRIILDQINRDLFPIPPLPQVVVELNDIASSREPDLQQARALVERDPQLTGRVLTIASSPAMGARYPLVDLKQAIMRLGGSGLRDITFALMMGRVFRGGSLSARMLQETRRTYVLACGTTCICKVLRMDQKYGFLAGLLADVGRLALLATLAEHGRQRPSWLRPEVIEELQRLLHTEVGELIIGRWKLPGLIKDVARCHHQPQKAGAAMPLALAVAAVDHLLLCEAHEPAALVNHMQGNATTFMAGLTLEHLPEVAQVVLQARADAIALGR